MRGLMGAGMAAIPLREAAVTTVHQQIQRSDPGIQLTQVVYNKHVDYVHLSDEHYDELCVGHRVDGVVTTLIKNLQVAHMNL